MVGEDATVGQHEAGTTTAGSDVTDDLRDSLPWSVYWMVW
jgi:hypothetical protein